MSKIVQWSEIESIASEMFNVWRGQPELIWAKKAWSAIECHGLTRFDGSLERALVHVRLITLAIIYYDFCDAAWDEVIEPDYLMWTSILGLPPFLIGQLVGPDFTSAIDREFDYPMCFEDPEDWEESVIAEALAELVERSRSEMGAALSKGFGGDSLLFAELWASLDGIQTLDNSDLNEIVNYTTPDKLTAFEWIGMGMPKRR